MRIMIIDDSRTIRRVLRMIIDKKIPLIDEIVESDSGEVALRKLEDLPVDLIILDVLMGGMNGYETCKKIKSNSKMKNTPVIFLTSQVASEDIVNGFDAGGVDYISKPIREAEFVARVSTQLKVITLQNKKIEKTQTEVLLKMGEIGELRSKETGNHVRRVAEYCRLLGEITGLEKHECDVLMNASPMHDIGKVAIQDSILNKPAKLTDEERLIMQEHTNLGYNMFKDSEEEILQAAAIVAHQHHEKFDGTGYPQQLQANQIHIYGRIIAIVDVFDALASDRVYKKAWELDKIIALFKEERGKHFDPYLLDDFLNNIGQFLAIKEKYIDEF